MIINDNSFVGLLVLTAEKLETCTVICVIFVCKYFVVENYRVTNFRSLAIALRIYHSHTKIL